MYADPSGDKYNKNQNQGNLNLCVTTKSAAENSKGESNSLWTPTSKQSDLWNKGKLKAHYEKHGISDFGAKTSKEYSDMAYKFGTMKSNNIIEAVEGPYVYRYEASTGNIFVGTLKGGKIKSFYKWDGKADDAVIKTLKKLGKL